jgi:tetratricopeptide (TPR) repeat protein
VRTAVLTLLIAALALVAQGQTDHVRPYLEGLQAEESGQWPTVVLKMSEAIAHQPQEMRSLRVRAGVIAYVPHFWLGIAYASLERWEESLHELKISEQQGVIQSTTHFAQLRSTKSRAESQIASRSAAVGIDEARRLADVAVKQAVTAQGRATSAGAARLEEFRQANQRLTEAMEIRKQGTAEGFHRAASRAEEATRMFEAATTRVTAESRVRAQPAPLPQRQEKPEVGLMPSSIEEEEPLPVPPQPGAPEPAAPAETDVATFDPVSRAERERPATSSPAGVSAPRPSPGSEPLTDPPPPTESETREAIQAAYLALASGRLDTAREMLDDVLRQQPRSVPALVLRGHLHYLEAVLTRRESLRDSAEKDFRAALTLDPRIRLDEKSFSPKVIQFFESIRASM